LLAGRSIIVSVVATSSKVRAGGDFRVDDDRVLKCPYPNCTRLLVTPMTDRRARSPSVACDRALRSASATAAASVFLDLRLGFKSSKILSHCAP
jgi:hypothetical protein